MSCFNIRILAILIHVFLLGCKNSNVETKAVFLNQNDAPTQIDDTLNEHVNKELVIQSEYSDYEQELMRQGFIDIKKIDSEFEVNLGYTKADNFTGEILYTEINHAFVHPKMAEKLVRAKTILQKENPNYTLLIFDALRPNSVQHKMWEIVKNTPKQRYVANPYTGSIHNYGLSVDLTIFDLSTKKEIPMGTSIDYLGRKAEYRYNHQLEQNGEITKQERLNRELLREVMTQAGFKPINSEWWHFNTFSSKETRRNFQMIQ